MLSKFNATLFQKNGVDAPQQVQKALYELGIILDITTGHLSYTEGFKPLSLEFELVFVRHGETFGNCGQSTRDGHVDKSLPKNPAKRIFQGKVDTPINQLTKSGKEQASYCADRLKHQLIENNWIPDRIFSSPLLRAKDTARPFVEQNHLQDRYFTCNDITEMSFGSWDNCRVCDLDDHDPCHLFYTHQNALVKSESKEAECFCDVILRAFHVLQKMNRDYAGEKIVMFSHSMFGAACCILLGKGQTIENGNYLAFDGKKSDGHPYTMPHATPFIMWAPSISSLTSLSFTN